MAERVQILHYLLHAFSIVDAHVCDVFLWRSDIVKDNGNLAVGEHLHEVRIHLGDDGREARYTPANHQPHAGNELLGAIIGVGDNYFVASRVSCRLKGAVDIEEKGILHVGHENSQGAALAPGQRSRMEIGMIFQFLRGSEDTCPSRVLNHV